MVETAPYPGIVEALEALTAAGHRLGVCTNKPVVAARRVLATLGLGWLFPCHYRRQFHPWRKPNPKHLEAALQELGAMPERAVMVGDHANDIDAAAGLGVPSIFVAWGYGKSACWGPDCIR